MNDIPPIDAVIDNQTSWLHDAEMSNNLARASAEKAIHGLVDAARVLLDNLAELHYSKVPGLEPAEPGIDDRIRVLTGYVGGPLPPALTLFWQLVGGLSLVDLSQYKHVKFWRKLGVYRSGDHCDGVHIYPCNSEWLDFTRQDYSDLHDDPDVSPHDSYALSISPDRWHKDNVSGSGGYEMQVGRGWLAPLLDFTWEGPRRPASAPSGPCDLLSYLRTSLLECAGFPGLYGIEAFEPIRVRLLRGVSLF